MKVFFHRDYQRFQGGHLKVFDYFGHLLALENYDPMVYFTPSSVWGDGNPWIGYEDYILHRWAPQEADLLFIAGMDWQALPETQRHFFPVPVINLIQAVRHADPQNKLWQFLSHRAVRICVSPEVHQAILSTGRVNGPIFTISNGLDYSDFPLGGRRRASSENLAILGMKMPQMARRLATMLEDRGIRVSIITEHLPRPEFLSCLAETSIVVFLPHEKEGFYLPALEGMALGSIVVCPDCIGNRSFCTDGLNCYRPQYNLKAIYEHTLKALEIGAEQKMAMLHAAQATAKKHTITAERKSFVDIIDSHKHQYFQNQHT